MQKNLDSEQASKHLYITMFVIVVSVVLISASMISSSYARYQLSKRSLVEIKSLKMAAELAHLISRERAPSNKLMSSSTAEESVLRKKELAEYRLTVDSMIKDTQQNLISSGFTEVAKCIDVYLYPSLTEGRKKIDLYAALPPHQKNMRNMDDAIVGMYHAWDSTYLALKHLVKDSKARESTLSDYYTLILILADLRDQAGRVASNVMPAVTYNQAIPKEKLGRTLQTQRQTVYLWEMIDTIQPEIRKTNEFTHLYNQVDKQFLKQGLPIINHLIDESLSGKPYSLTGTELTNAIVDHFVTVINLQDYLLKQSLTIAEQEHANALNQLLFQFIVSCIALIGVLTAMFYIKHWIFNPLIYARNSLVELINSNNQNTDERKDLRLSSNKEFTLFDAIKDLKKMLKQRDDFEFQLKNLANSDALTGVGNRLALDEYIKYIEQQATKFSDFSLIVIDIDYFKQVNDQFGHLIGDDVIKEVTKAIKQYIRASDFVVRYGGDEFLILMQNTPLTRAKIIAENIRSALYLQNLKISHPQNSLHISLSMGVAHGYTDWHQLMNEADQALLRAKSAGRNCVRCA